MHRATMRSSGPWDGEEAITLMADLDADANGALIGAADQSGPAGPSRHRQEIVAGCPSSATPLTTVTPLSSGPWGSSDTRTMPSVAGLAADSCCSR
ncbi:hypothetical protein C7T35_28905 [Variovorax sp. WS11]|nr:hypothetical protein C7T35_28905 [Variovorax sp. WS11]